MCVVLFFSSSFLFFSSLFINELDLEIFNNGKNRVSFSSIFVKLFILLFAVDIIFLSETVTGLQTQLNSLCYAASTLKLKADMNKNSIMVFKEGGYLASREMWFYDDMKMEVVNSYKYLSIYFTTKISFAYACQDLVSRGGGGGVKLCQYTE